MDPKDLLKGSIGILSLNFILPTCDNLTLTEAQIWP